MSLRAVAAAALISVAPVAAHALAVGDAFSELSVSISGATPGTGAVYAYVGSAETFGDGFADAAHVEPASVFGFIDDLVGADPILDVFGSATASVDERGSEVTDATASAFIFIDNSGASPLLMDIAFDYELFAFASADLPPLEAALAGSTVVLETFDPFTGVQTVLFNETIFADTEGVFGPGGGDQGSFATTFAVPAASALELVAFVEATAGAASEVPVPAAAPLLALALAFFAALRSRR